MVRDLSCFIVDDDEDDREILMIALKEVCDNPDCTIAVNGKDALSKLQVDEHFVPDYIFLDLNMPVLNGKECLKEIKKTPRLDTIPVIIYTTSSYYKDVEELEKLGSSHFLVKPSAIDDLIRILSSIFQKQPLPFLLNAERE